MSSQKVISGNGFNEGAALVQTNSTGVFSSLSSDLSRAAVPAEEYRHSVDPSFGSISVGAASGTIVAGVTDREIEVLSYTLVADSATEVRWKSGSNNLSGGMSFAANGGASANDNEPMLRTNVGEDLILVNSAGNLEGHLTYRIV
jgi:hypothetical protein